MIKQDLRHTNNSRSNKNLHTEMDLWCRYIDNNKQPLLLGTAIAPAQKGYYGDKYKLFYSPSEYDKQKPFLLKSEKGIRDFLIRCENIKQAKYFLKKENPGAKWQR